MYIATLERIMVVSLVCTLLALSNIQVVQSDNIPLPREARPLSVRIDPKSYFPHSDSAEPKKEKWVVVSAYSLDPGQTDDPPCIPANGEDLCKLREQKGFHDTIAANFLRMGTQVKIPELYGNKVLVARDRMNTRYNGTNRIDLLLDSREEAIKFGIKYVKLEIY